MTDARVPPAVLGASPIRRVYERFAATVVQVRQDRPDHLDPRITEVVRLRCARVHDCRLCGSLRDAAAREAGLDETLADRVDDYEASDFPDSWKAALRLADAVILLPSSADESLREELGRHFSEAQIAELLFDVMKWSWQKAVVALRLEPPLEGVADLAFAPDGTPLLGEAARSALAAGRSSS